MKSKTTKAAPAKRGHQNSTCAGSTSLVFVYGSLKRGFGNHHFLREQRFLGEARTRPVYRLLSFHAYPGMIEADNQGRSIHGEVWEVDAACKEALDQLEGVNYGHYNCVAARLLAPFDKAPVLTYLYARDAADWPDAGDNWVRLREIRRARRTKAEHEGVKFTLNGGHDS
jgi:gamma-glutamylaminecyclotransferase